MPIDHGSRAAFHAPGAHPLHLVVAMTNNSGFHWPMEIRPARNGDSGGVASVHVASWRAAYCGIVPEAYLESLSVQEREIIFRSMVDKGTPELWVADLQGKIAGWVSFGASHDGDASATTGEIEAIYVAPGYWGTGCGWSLWEIALRRLVARGFSKVTLWVLTDNLRARRFYGSVGLKPRPETGKDMGIGGKAFTELRYKRVIG